MLTCNLFGEEIYICTRPEARAMWADKNKRPRLWLEEEVGAHLLAPTERVMEMAESKRRAPGRLLV